jgi:multisubunit Na+/H+ antiporter MnhB subunit
MTNTTNPTTQARRRYLFEFGIFMAAYVSVCLVWMFHGASGHGRIAIALLAMIPIFFVFAAMVRYVLRTDEFDRKVSVESLALAGGTTALIAAIYGLLEGAGFPKQSAWCTYAVFMIGWIIAKFLVLRRYK